MVYQLYYSPSPYEVLSTEYVLVLSITPQYSHLKHCEWKNTFSTDIRSMMYTRFLQKKQNSLAGWDATIIG